MSNRKRTPRTVPALRPRAAVAGDGWVYVLILSNPTDRTDISIGGVYDGEIGARAAANRVAVSAGRVVLPIQINADMFPTYKINGLVSIDPHDDEPDDDATGGA